MSAGGKGHAPRPFSVTPDEYAGNWDRIFGKKEEPELEMCPFCGLRTERPCDDPPPAPCDELNRAMLEGRA